MHVYWLSYADSPIIMTFLLGHLWRSYCPFCLHTKKGEWIYVFLSKITFNFVCFCCFLQLYSVLNFNFMHFFIVWKNILTVNIYIFLGKSGQYNWKWREWTHIKGDNLLVISKNSRPVVDCLFAVSSHDKTQYDKISPATIE